MTEKPTYPTATHYSPHFTRKELDCRCGCKPPHAVVAALAQTAAELEALRALAGAPVVVNCAYRCKAHNKAVGGVPDSQHVRGLAADVTIAGKHPAAVADLAAKVMAFKRGGIGTYSAFTHVDRRPNGPARWNG